MILDLVVIGICGRARSGKSTAAAALELHRGCHRIALADPIRSALQDLGMPGGEVLKELTPDFNYRRAMQLLGTESRDAVNAPGLWIHLLLAKVHYLANIHPSPRTRFVIPDIRFRHERAMILHQVNRWGGRLGVLKLIRPGESIAESSHASEAEFDAIPCECHYDNNGTIDDLIVESIALFDAVKEGRMRAT